MSRFADRAAAGRELAERLERYADRRDGVVLGLARGGMPVAFQVARALHIPLDVFLVRKLGVPGRPELAMGAMASGGVRVVNEQVVESLRLAEGEIDAVVQREQHELDRREGAYRAGRPATVVDGRLAILVDDGLATGASMRAAVQALKQRHAAEIVVAVPIAPPDTCAALRLEVDAVVCVRTPEPFGAVGEWYEEFEQTTDEEVRDLVGRAGSGVRHVGDHAASRRAGRHRRLA